MTRRGIAILRIRRCRNSDESRRRREQRYALLLDTVEFASGVVETIADGAVNVPGLKAAAGLVNQIVVIAQAVRLNRRDCDNLVERVCDFFNLITDELAGLVVVDTKFRRRLEAFQQELLYTKDLIERLVSRRYLIRWLQYAADRREIDDCKMRLTDAFERLMLGHMINNERQLAFISGGINVVTTDMHALYTSQEIHSGRFQTDLLAMGRGIRNDMVEILAGLDAVGAKLPKAIGYDPKEYIRGMSPAAILWHPWALCDAAEVARTTPCFRGDVQTWVEAKLVVQLLRFWPGARRALVSGWDFFSHDMRAQYLHAGFFIHIEYPEPRRFEGDRKRWRYVQIELYATGLEGMCGATTSLDENCELVRGEMDEQSLKAPYMLEDEKGGDGDGDGMGCTPF